MNIKTIKAIADASHKLEDLIESSVNSWLSDNPDKEVEKLLINTDLTGGYGKALVTILYTQNKEVAAKLAADKLAKEIQDKVDAAKASADKAAETARLAKEKADKAAKEAKDAAAKAQAAIPPATQPTKEEVK